MLTLFVSLYGATCAFLYCLEMHNNTIKRFKKVQKKKGKNNGP